MTTFPDRESFEHQPANLYDGLRLLEVPKPEELRAFSREVMRFTLDRIGPLTTENSLELSYYDKSDGDIEDKPSIARLYFHSERSDDGEESSKRIDILPDHNQPASITLQLVNGKPARLYYHTGLDDALEILDPSLIQTTAQQNKHVALILSNTRTIFKRIKQAHIAGLDVQTEYVGPYADPTKKYGADIEKISEGSDEEVEAFYSGTPRADIEG